MANKLYLNFPIYQRLKKDFYFTKTKKIKQCINLRKFYAFGVSLPGKKTEQVRNITKQVRKIVSDKCLVRLILCPPPFLIITT